MHIDQSFTMLNNGLAIHIFYNMFSKYKHMLNIINKGESLIRTLVATT